MGDLVSSSGQERWTVERRAGDLAALLGLSQPEDHLVLVPESRAIAAEAERDNVKEQWELVGDKLKDVFIEREDARAERDEAQKYADACKGWLETVKAGRDEAIANRVLMVRDRDDWKAQAETECSIRERAEDKRDEVARRGDEAVKLLRRWDTEATVSDVDLETLRDDTRAFLKDG